MLTSTGQTWHCRVVMQRYACFCGWFESFLFSVYISMLAGFEALFILHQRDDK